MGASNILSHVAAFRELPALQDPSFPQGGNLGTLLPAGLASRTWAHDLISTNQTRLLEAVM